MGERLLVEKQRQKWCEGSIEAMRRGARVLATADGAMMSHCLRRLLHTFWTSHPITIPGRLPLQDSLSSNEHGFWSLEHGGLACTLSLLNGYHL